MFVRIALLALLAAPAAAGEATRLPPADPAVVEPLPIESVSAWPEAAGNISAAPSEGGAIALDEAEALALSGSPSVAALEAQVRAALHDGWQAGLPPNPTAGYVVSEAGVDGNAGQQGAFFGQTFVRGGKLGWARAVSNREADRLVQEVAVERLRVLTDTRTVYYNAHLAQMEVELAERLHTLSDRAAEAAGALRDAGEGPRTSVLQAEIERRRAEATRARAEQRWLAAWRELAALTRLPAVPPRRTAADLESLRAPGEAIASFESVCAASPRIAERVAAVAKARTELAYQRSLAVQDVTAQAMVQYDDSANDTIAGLQVGMPLPLWNRNQGGICRARAELTAATRDLESAEQRLRRDLAVAVGRHESARALVEALEGDVLPRAQETLDLVTEGYRAGEAPFLELLTAQRTYFQVSLETLDAYRELNEATQLLRGALLSGSGGSP